MCLVAIGTKSNSNRKQSVFFNETFSHETSQTRKNSFEEIDFTNRDLLINPGVKYIIKPDDICIYASLFKEENYDFKDAKFMPGIIN